MDEEQQQQHDYYDVEVFKALRVRGVWADVAEELARDPWCTPERLEAGWRDLVRRGDRVGNRTALWVANLRAHRDGRASWER